MIPLFVDTSLDFGWFSVVRPCGLILLFLSRETEICDLFSIEWIGKDTFSPNYSAYIDFFNIRTCDIFNLCYFQHCLQTHDSNFEPLSSASKRDTARTQRLPTILNIYDWTVINLNTSLELWHYKRYLLYWLLSLYGRNNSFLRGLVKLTKIKKSEKKLVKPKLGFLCVFFCVFCTLLLKKMGKGWVIAVWPIFSRILDLFNLTRPLTNCNILVRCAICLHSTKHVDVIVSLL